MQQIISDAYYSMPDAACLLGVHYRKLVRMAVAGTIPTTRVGHYRLVRGDDLRETLKKHQQGDRDFAWKPQRATSEAVTRA